MSAKKGLYGTWMAVLGLAVLIGLYTTYKLFADGHVLFNTNDVILWSLKALQLRKHFQLHRGK